MTASPQLELPPTDATPPSPAPAAAPSDPPTPAGEASPAPGGGDPPPAPTPETLLGGAPIEGAAPPPAAEPTVPETFALTLPEQTHLDAAALERISQVAKAMKLTSLDQAQAIVTAVDAELAEQVKVLQAATVKGGVIYAETVKAFTKAALADPDIGGTPERLSQTVDAAKAALARYDHGGTFAEFLETTGWGSSPAVLGMLARIHADTREDRMVRGAPPSPPPKSLGETFYGDTMNKG